MLERLEAFQVQLTGRNIRDHQTMRVSGEIGAEIAKGADFGVTHEDHPFESIYPFYRIARRTGEQKANKEGKAREREGEGAGGDDCGDAGRFAGGGKTTLIKCILGLLKPTGGEIIFHTPEKAPIRTSSEGTST